MNKNLFCLVFLSSSLISFGQLNFEAHVGGSDFLGGSLNSSYEINLSQNRLHHLLPSVGFGFLLPGWAGSTVILHTGLNYTYKNWGGGAEVSGFTANPFWGNSDESDFSDLIIFPNANYTFNTRSNWYFKVSAGALFAFAKNYEYGSSHSKMVFEGDVIPALAVSAGYRFRLQPLNP
jgi:hypothetical protein